MRTEGLLAGLAPTKQQAKEAEPPKDEGGDGGGRCEHPECATEHIIMAAIMQIMEALNVFVYAQWDFSDYMCGELAEFAEGLLKAFGPDADVSELPAEIGEIFIPPIKRKGHDDRD